MDMGLLFAGVGKGGLQLGLILMGEGRLEDGAARAAQGVEDLVGEVGIDQHEQGGRARRQVFGQLLHKIVIDAHVAQSPGHRTGPGTDHEAQQRVEEDEPDEHAPETAAHRSAGGKIVHLVQLDFAVLLLLDDDRVLKGNKVRLLHLQKGKADFFGLVFVVIRHGNQFTHGKPPGS